MVIAALREDVLGGEGKVQLAARGDSSTGELATRLMKRARKREVLRAEEENILIFII